MRERTSKTRPSRHHYNRGRRGTGPGSAAAETWEPRQVGAARGGERGAGVRSKGTLRLLQKHHGSGLRVAQAPPWCPRLLRVRVSWHPVHCFLSSPLRCPCHPVDRCAVAATRKGSEVRLCFCGMCPSLHTKGCWLRRRRWVEGGRAASTTRREQHRARWLDKPSISHVLSPVLPGPEGSRRQE